MTFLSIVPHTVTMRGPGSFFLSLWGFCIGLLYEYGACTEQVVRPFLRFGKCVLYSLEFIFQNFRGVLAGLFIATSSSGLHSVST
jgi:hypothetical protein